MSVDDSGWDQPPRDPRIGSVLGARYRLESKLGDGGMGAVYAGVHVGIGRRVAVKLLHPNLASDYGMIQRFRQEAQAVNAIGHPNIVEVTDMGRTDDGAPFLVMELLEGVSLGSYLQDQAPLEVGETVEICLQLCRALAAAHARGIVHRDLKPENVFLTERDGARFIKVLDFGIAKTVGGLGPTRTGAALGTPHYMPPEQARGETGIDGRADIYALGVMMFQMLTDAFPLDDESFVGLLAKIAVDEPPSLHRYRPELPAPLVALVHRMLAKRREDRPPSMEDVIAHLNPFRGNRSRVSGHPSGSVPGCPVPPTRISPDHETPRGGSTVALRQNAPEAAGTDGPTESQLGAVRELDPGVPGTDLELAFPSPERLPPGNQQRRHRAGIRSTIAVLGFLGAFLLAMAGWWFWPAESLPAPSRLTQPGAGVYQVRVRVTTNPSHADLSLDGAPVANPFEERFAADGTVHVFEVQAEGHHPRRQEVRFELPLDLQLELEPR